MASGYVMGRQMNSPGELLMTVKSDIEIAREAKMKPIMAIGKGLGIPEKELIPYGHTKAKVSL